MNQHLRRSEHRVLPLDDPAVDAMSDHPSIAQVRGAGFEPASPGSRPGSLPLADPRGCGGRNRTCVGAVNSRLPVPARVPPHQQVRTAGFEPAISCARGTRNPRLSHVLKQERPAGIEPTLPPWQGSRLPLHHGRLCHNQIVKQREHRAGLEPASPHYGCGVLAARRPVLVSRTRGTRTLTLLVKSQGCCR